MFTGIVQETGEILSEEHSADGAKFEIGSVQLLGDLKRGDSISVDGVCLTVSKKRKGAITVEMTPETLKCTNLGERRAGDRVNLEPSARLSDFLGGHLVQGHVDQTGEVLAITKVGNSQVFRIAAPEEVLRYCTLKGSATVNGVSLTLSALDSESFEVTIIPHTMEVTNFKELKVGDRVNLEADVVSKYVESHVSKYLQSHVQRRLGLLAGVVLLSSTLLFGSDLALAPNSVLVYQNQTRQGGETQFVIRVARFQPDIFLEWESTSDQGTLHLYQSAVEEARSFTLTSLFEVGVEMESSDTMTYWLSERMYQELTEDGETQVMLNRSPVKMQLKSEGTYRLTVNKEVEEIPTISIEDDRKGTWTFHKSRQNPLLLEYVTPYFHQRLTTVSIAPTNRLRWIRELPPVK
ncbi:MAG: riboflavin synthase [Acidobacteria bacterium]|nr:riboflavin synthase [Acidobacteriota bacterium]